MLPTLDGEREPKRCVEARGEIRRALLQTEASRLDQHREEFILAGVVTERENR